MSLEESMKALAESNVKLAEAQNAHTAGLLAYIDFQKNGGGSSATTATADAAAAPSGRGRKAKDKPAEAEAAPAAAAEPDPFAEEGEEEEAAPELTAEVIRGLVMKVKDKDKALALGLLKKIGAETVSKIDPKDYQKVVDLAAKVGVTL